MRATVTTYAFCTLVSLHVSLLVVDGSTELNPVGPHNHVNANTNLNDEVSDFRSLPDAISATARRNRHVPSFESNSILERRSTSDGEAWASIKTMMDHINDGVTTANRKIGFIEKNMAENANSLYSTGSVLDEPHIWKISNWTVKKENGFVFSEPFYQSNYRMKLLMSPSSKIGLYLGFVRGDYDGMLVWPFEYNYTLIIFHQGSPPNKSLNVEKFATPIDSTDSSDLRPHGEKDIKGWGFSQIISMDDLNSKGFVKNDSILVGVKIDGGKSSGLGKLLSKNAQQMAALERAVTATAEKTHSSRGSDGQFIWKIENFMEKRSLAERGLDQTKLFSVPFYMANYRMKLILHPFGGSHGSHISLYLGLVKGDYDDILEWPFSLRYTFTLFHQGPPANKTKNYEISIVASACTAELAHRMPQGEKDNMGCGLSMFVPINDIKSQGFVKNDNLYVGFRLGDT